MSDQVPASDKLIESSASANERRIEDALVLGGLLKSPEAEALIETLKSNRGRMLQIEESAYLEDAEQLKEELGDIQSRRNAYAAKRNELDERKRTKAIQIKELHNELGSRLLERRNLISRLSAKRYAYPIKLASLKIDEFSSLSEKMSKSLLDNEKKRLEYEKVLHEIATERRNLSQSELQRRVELLSKKRDEAADKRQEIEARLDRLRALGVTQTTAGFMRWGGYLGFTAIGWYLGQILQKISSDDELWLRDFLTIIFGATYDVIETLGRSLGIPVLMLTPVALWLLAIGVLFLSDKLLRFFDPSWSSKKSTLKRERRRGILDRLQDIQKIHRTDYVEWLARAPLVVIVAEIFLALSVFVTLGGRQGSSGPLTLLPEPWKALYFTFFGIILTVMIAGFVVLYCTKLVEPRILLTDKASNVPATVRTNWEILTLFVISAIALVGTEAVRMAFPNVPPLWSPDNAALAFLLAFLNAFVVGYGLIYGGINKDFTATKRSMEAYELEIQKYAAFPLVQTDEEDVNRFRNELQKLFEEIDRHWRDAAFQEKATELWGLSESDSGIFSRLWRGKSLEEDKGYTAADEFLEPDTVAALVNAMNSLWETRRAIATAEAELDNLEEESGQLRIDSLDDKIGELRGRLSDRTHQYKRSMAQLEKDFALQIAHAEGAYQLGVTLRDWFAEQSDDPAQ